MGQQNPAPIDTLYQTYDRGLYKITGNEEENSILDMIDSNNPSATQSQSMVVDPSDVGSGVSTSTVQNATGSDQSGKTIYDNTQTGYILGFDPKDGKAKFFIGDSINYLNWDGTSLIISGSITASAINIPDTTSSNSFHVDSSGNTWWGANIAGGIAASTASISASGQAIFKNIAIGGATLQYTVTNEGVANFGDGSDGDVIISVDTSLNSDKYYKNLTVNAGVTLNANGWRIFVSEVLTCNGHISRDGNAGTGGANATGGGPGAGGTAGAALADGYLKGSVAGQNGGAGGGGSSSGAGSAGSAGTSGSGTTNSIGSNGSAGGAGGVGGTNSNPGQGGAGGGGSNGGTATASNVKLIANWHLATLLDIGSTGSTVKFDNSASSGSGGGGGGGAQLGPVGNVGGSGGGGGASGSAGGILAIYAKTITISATGSITANGGAGGNGGNGSDAVFTGPGGNSGAGGGGGGGGGGAGGQVILVYNDLTNGGTISASAGAHGTGGAIGAGSSGIAPPVAGTDGTIGAAGNVRQFSVSL